MFLTLPATAARLAAIPREPNDDAAYYKWRLQRIIPLFEEARDALCAISTVSAKLHNVDLSLGDRMDKAGTATRAMYDAAQGGKP